MLLYISSRFFIDEKGMSGKSILNTFVSTARCSSSRNSLRGIHPSIHPVDILLKGGATSSLDGMFVKEKCVNDNFAYLPQKILEAMICTNTRKVNAPRIDQS